MYKESWGELLTTKVHSVVCVLDVETCVVTTLESIPNGVSPGQVRFLLRGVAKSKKFKKSELKEHETQQ